MLRLQREHLSGSARLIMAPKKKKRVIPIAFIIALAIHLLAIGTIRIIDQTPSQTKWQIAPVIVQADLKPFHIAHAKIREDRTVYRFLAPPPHALTLPQLND